MNTYETYTITFEVRPGSIFDVRHCNHLYYDNGSVSAFYCINIWDEDMAEKLQEVKDLYTNKTIHVIGKLEERVTF